MGGHCWIGPTSAAPALLCGTGRAPHCPGQAGLAEALFALQCCEKRVWAVLGQYCVPAASAAPAAWAMPCPCSSSLYAQPVGCR